MALLWQQTAGACGGDDLATEAGVLRLQRVVPNAKIEDQNI